MAEDMMGRAPVPTPKLLSKWKHDTSANCTERIDQWRRRVGLYELPVDPPEAPSTEVPTKEARDVRLPGDHGFGRG